MADKVWPIAFAEHPSDPKIPGGLWASNGQFYDKSDYWWSLGSHGSEPTDYGCLNNEWAYKVVGIVKDVDIYCFIKRREDNKLFYLRNTGSGIIKTTWSIDSITRQALYIPSPKLFLPPELSVQPHAEVSKSEIITLDWSPINSQGECYWHKNEPCSHRR